MAALGLYGIWQSRKGADLLRLKTSSTAVSLVSGQPLNLNWLLSMSGCCRGSGHATSGKLLPCSWRRPRAPAPSALEEGVLIRRARHFRCQSDYLKGRQSGYIFCKPLGGCKGLIIRYLCRHQATCGLTAVNGRKESLCLIRKATVEIPLAEGWCRARNSQSSCESWKYRSRKVE